MKTILKYVVLSAFAGVAVVSAEPANKKCPVSGKDVDVTITSKHTVVVGFCCEKCQAGFKKNPNGEKFAAGIVAAAGKPVNELCPVSGKEVDAEETALHKGQTVGFCCGKCLAKFEKAPAEIFAKVKADHPGNPKCPVSGKEIDVETAVVHTQEFGFCCEKCQAKFDKNPAAVIAKRAEKKPKKE